MKKVLWCILLIGSSLLTKAQGNIMFEQANELYHSNNYDSAAQLYTQLAQNGYCSNDLYYNMGNAFYKAQKIGWAIWSYRKSMQIQCDQNTLDNYRLAKNQIKDPLLEQKEIFFLRWWKGLYSFFTVNTWAFIALGSFVVFLFVFYMQAIKKKRVSNILRYSFLILFLLSLLFMFIQYYNQINHYEAVLVDAAYIELIESKEKEKIPEGSEIKIIDKNPGKREGFALVQLSDLRQGYLTKESYKRL